MESPPPPPPPPPPPMPNPKRVTVSSAEEKKSSGVLACVSLVCVAIWLNAYWTDTLMFRPMNSTTPQHLAGMTRSGDCGEGPSVTSEELELFIARVRAGEDVKFFDVFTECAYMLPYTKSAGFIDLTDEELRVGRIRWGEFFTAKIEHELRNKIDSGHACYHAGWMGIPANILAAKMDNNETAVILNPRVDPRSGPKNLVLYPGPLGIAGEDTAKYVSMHERVRVSGAAGANFVFGFESSYCIQGALSW